LKLLATIHKEFLQMARDPGGLALIFLMPLALVMVMALIQDNTFREMQETGLDVLVVDEDQGPLGVSLEQTLRNSPNIRLIKKVAGETLSVETARRLVQSGKYKTALIIPGKASLTLRDKARGTVISLMAHYGFVERQTGTEMIPPLDLQILFDPAIKANYKQMLVNAVEKMIAAVQMEWFMEEMQKQLGRAAKKQQVAMDLSPMITVSQRDASTGAGRGTALNAVQHNVPAWTLFAMFFILFPLAGNFIREREEGSMLRLRLISGSQLPVIAGKFIFYLFVCLLQLILMIGAGLYLMPLFGLAKLVLGTNWPGIAMAGFSVAMAATGYGLLIAVYFKTPQQALSFGSISVVILAAIGGVWVPVFAMPEIMQTISPFSPLHWGMSAFNDLFLRNAPTSVILPEVIKLLCFAGVTLAASILIHKSRTVS